MSTPPDAIDALLREIDTSDVGSVISEIKTDNGADDMSDILEAVADDDKNRIGQGIITIFPPSTHPSWLNPDTYFTDTDVILEKWCGKFEVAPATGTIHAHLFFKFNRDRRMRFNVLRKLISDKVGKNPNIKRARSHSAKSIQCAINYVLKTDTAAVDTVPFIWKNSCEFSQKVWDERKSNKKDANAEIIAYIMSKPESWLYDKIVHENDESRLLLASCSWAKRLHEGRGAAAPRRTIQNVVIMYGAPGTGKSTMAEQWEKPDDVEVSDWIYERNPADGNFWGGGRTAYRGQPVIWEDEFTGQERFSDLKKWCDTKHYGTNVAVKNGGRELNHHTFIFTSNVHPAGWYHNMWSKDPKQFGAFHRRVTKVLFFPVNRPDGSRNDPDSDHDPYYIDQSDEWAGMEREYQACLDHAESCWPLPSDITEPDAGGAFAPGFNPNPEGPKRPGDIYMAEQNKRRRFF